jgi:hypothetical protein
MISSPGNILQLSCCCTVRLGVTTAQASGVYHQGQVCWLHYRKRLAYHIICPFRIGILALGIQERT